MEQISGELHPTPGQLWQNVRTGDVLFIYGKNCKIEGVIGNGKKISYIEVMKIAKRSNGWTCVFQRALGGGDVAERSDSFEFKT